MMMMCDAVADDSCDSQTFVRDFDVVLQTRYVV